VTKKRLFSKLVGASCPLAPNHHGGVSAFKFLKTPHIILIPFFIFITLQFFNIDFCFLSWIHYGHLVSRINPNTCPKSNAPDLYGLLVSSDLMGLLQPLKSPGSSKTLPTPELLFAQTGVGQQLMWRGEFQG